MTHQNLSLPYTFNFHIAHITYKNEESKHFLKILFLGKIYLISCCNAHCLIKLTQSGHTGTIMKAQPKTAFGLRRKRNWHLPSKSFFGYLILCSQGHSLSNRHFLSNTKGLSLLRKHVNIPIYVCKIAVSFLIG